MTVLTTAQVNNYQSLSNVELELAPFTVLVGPSSSGKSAFFRAMRALVSNQRGNSFISHGERVCTISGQFPQGKVTLKRGKSADANEYVTIDNEGEQKKYTKLHASTPEEVTAFMGIPPKDSLNMVGQFDKPYLLDESAGEVARVLGELTNVRVVFDAARESNRRKLAKSATLTTRKADLEAVTEKIETYKPLKAQIESLENAEQSYDTLSELLGRVNAIQSFEEQASESEKIISESAKILDAELPSADTLFSRVESIKTLQSVLEQVQTSAKAITSANAVLESEIPTSNRLSDLLTELDSLRAFEKEVTKAKNTYIAQKEAEESTLKELTKAQDAYITALQDMKICPTCNQSTEGVH